MKRTQNAKKLQKLLLFLGFVLLLSWPSEGLASETGRRDTSETANGGGNFNWGDVHVVNPLHKIIVTPSEYGTVKVDMAKAHKGERITLEIEPNENCRLDKLTVTRKKGKEQVELEVQDNWFVMPGAKVTVTATFSSLKKISIEESDHGRVMIDKNTAWPNDPVNFTVEPEPGYTLDRLIVRQADGTDVTVEDNSFKMPNSDVTITPTFREIITVTVTNGNQLENAFTYADHIIIHRFSTLRGDFPVPVGRKVILTFHNNASISGSLYINGDLTIEGSSLSALRGSLYISGHLTLDGGIHIRDDYTNSLPQRGILVDNGGSFTMKNGVIADFGLVESGGGVYIANGGTFMMYGGTISNNSAKKGGGVYVKEGGTFIQSGGDITQNEASENGGGVYVAEGGTFILSDGTVTDNKGGDVYQETPPVAGMMETISLSTEDVTLSSYIYTYDGKAKKPGVTVKINGATLTKGTDYSVSYATGRKNAGTYAVTVTGKGNYKGTIIKYFTIEEAPNPLKVTAASEIICINERQIKTGRPTLKADKLFRFIDKGLGTITYTKKSGDKKITIDKKTGELKIHKCLKKGLYKVAIKITAHGAENYRPKSQTVLLNIWIGPYSNQDQ